MLRVENLSIGFNDTPVVKNASFNLGKSEIGCLLGQSGCGKTSLLRAIAGFQPAMEGAVYLQDTLVLSAEISVPARQRRVGMMFQDYALFPHLTVKQNVMFGVEKLATGLKRATDCLELVDLTAFQDHYPHQLSGGQQQRVALARAIAPQPRLLLLDEPFSSLDVELRERLASDIRFVLKQQSITALLVTHDQNEAFSFADKIGVIQKGRIQQWADAATLYQQPATESVAQFIGEGVLVSINKTHSLIRPQQVIVKPDGKWQGKVIARHFRGTHFVLLVESLGLQTNASSPILVHAPLDTGFDTGASISFDLSLEQALQW